MLKKITWSVYLYLRENSTGLLINFRDSPIILNLTFKKIFFRLFGEASLWFVYIHTF